MAYGFPLYSCISLKRLWKMLHVRSLHSIDSMKKHTPLCPSLIYLVSGCAILRGVGTILTKSLSDCYFSYICCEVTRISHCFSKAPYSFSVAPGKHFDVLFLFWFCKFTCYIIAHCWQQVYFLLFQNRLHTLNSIVHPVISHNDRQKYSKC